ncbi:MAG TPA: hypothetical protein EYQ26_08050 [Rhodospirillales bacterium]|jgi:hypothetical protein|nr:hypothetical protein [Rhodospirillales bacterium]HIL76973.1 hypothetical protein [Rhodospirillales bacterium]
MQLDEFNRTNSIVGALTGGVSRIDQALLNIGSLAKNQAAASVQNIMASRIDKALAHLNSAPSTALSDHLQKNQSLLISRKDGINEAITVVSKSLAQINDIRNHIDYLRKRLTFLENGDLTAVETAEEWDNILRRIQLSSRAAGGIIKEGNVFTPKNLINTEFRESFKTQNLYAPYSSDVGDLMRIDGVYLGTDYYITEDGSGDFWNSDTNTLKYESQAGTLTEYSNYSTNTRTGQYETVETLRVNSYDDSTGVINFTLGGYSQRMMDDEPNNSMENAQHQARQAFKLDASNTDVGSAGPNGVEGDGDDIDLQWTSITGTIANPVGTTLSTQDYDWFKFDLQRGEKLTFDVDYGSGMSNNFDSFLDFFDEAGAKVATDRTLNSGDPAVYTADGTPGFNDDDGDVTLGGGGSTGASAYDTYIEKEVQADGVYYVRMRAYNYNKFDTAGNDRDGEGDYVINISITPATDGAGNITSTGLGGGDIDGIVTGGGLALLDAWIYKNFETQPSINQARDALDAAEALVLTTEANFLQDRSTLESRASIFSSQIDGMGKEIRDLIEDIQDEARAELLARQLEYTIAQFDFTLLAARSNTLIQSILISQNSSGYGKSTQENASRVGITLNQSQRIWG